jgi:hypothetical protein
MLALAGARTDAIAESAKVNGGAPLLIFPSYIFISQIHYLLINSISYRVFLEEVSSEKNGLAKLTLEARVEG